MPNKAFAVIRRWTAPRDGFVAIDGTLIHSAKQGDGVRGHIVSGRLGELGSWIAMGSQSATTLPRVQVRRGEVIDFIVDGRANPNNDAYKWAIHITMAGGPNYPPGCVMAWDTQKDFSGDAQIRHLNSWEKLAQVLLETNELTFVN